MTKRTSELPRAFKHYMAMKGRYEDLEWRFSDKEFWEWYGSYQYGSKIVCERLRQSGMG